MKKLTILVLIFAGIAVSASAMSFWVGPNAYYGRAITPDSVTGANVSSITLKDLAFGAEGRLYLGPLAGSISAEYLGSKKILLLADAGLNLKLLFFRFGLGIGPNYKIKLGGGNAALGGNLRATAEIQLGGLAAGLSWFSMVEFNKASIAEAFNNPYGFLGATVTFRM